MAEITWSMCGTAFIRKIGNVKPARTRAAVLKQIVGVIAYDPVCLGFYQQRVQKNGRLSYHDVEDSIGEALANWKDSWERGEDEELDHLSGDMRLVKMIEKVVQDNPTVDLAGQDTRDYGAAVLSCTLLSRRLNDLSSRTYSSSISKDVDLEQARTYCKEILRILA